MRQTMSLLNSHLIDIQAFYTLKTFKNGYVKFNILSNTDLDLIQKQNQDAKAEFEKQEQEKKASDESYEIQEYKTPEKYDIQVLNTKWKEISWDDQNSILRNSIRKDQMTGQDELDNVNYNDTLLKQALVEWDLKDDSGQPIPCSPEMIGRLPYAILRNLMSKYEKIVFLGEEDEKKS